MKWGTDYNSAALHVNAGAKLIVGDGVAARELNSLFPTPTRKARPRFSHTGMQRLHSRRRRRLSASLRRHSYRRRRPQSQTGRNGERLVVFLLFRRPKEFLTLDSQAQRPMRRPRHLLPRSCQERLRPRCPGIPPRMFRFRRHRLQKSRRDCWSQSSWGRPRRHERCLPLSSSASLQRSCRPRLRRSSRAEYSRGSGQTPCPADSIDLPTPRTYTPHRRSCSQYLRKAIRRRSLRRQCRRQNPNLPPGPLAVPVSFSSCVPCPGALLERVTQPLLRRSRERRQPSLRSE